jgi:hypothetical protein
MRKCGSAGTAHTTANRAAVRQAEAVLSSGSVRTTALVNGAEWRSFELARPGLLSRACGIMMRLQNNRLHQSKKIAHYAR